jgi:hypothetical protein
MSNGKNLTKKYDCLKSKVMESNSGNKEYEIIRKAFTDTLNDWMYLKKLRYYENYPTMYNIRKDTLVFFNDSNNRALLFLQLQSNSNCKCTDIVVLIAAEKEDEKWHFYNSVNFQYIVSEGRTTRYSFDELSKMSVMRTMTDGLVKRLKRCNQDSDYITRKWFPEKRRHYHQKFLNSEY